MRETEEKKGGREKERKGGVVQEGASVMCLIPCVSV